MADTRGATSSDQRPDLSPQSSDVKRARTKRRRSKSSSPSRTTTSNESTRRIPSAKNEEDRQNDADGNGTVSTIFSSKQHSSTDKPVRIYCDGVMLSVVSWNLIFGRPRSTALVWMNVSQIYDLFHSGHARALEQAKKAFPNVYLLVGVCGDALTIQKKGRTVLNEKQRAESLRHCKWVDEVIELAPWVVDQAFLDKHQIDYVAHDDLPYAAAGTTDVYDFVKKQGKFLTTKRTEGISTSDIITKIIKDYEMYVQRNLDRGVLPKDLNLSPFKVSELKVKKQMRDLGNRWKEKIAETEESIRHNWKSTGQEISSDWNIVLNGFLRRFGYTGGTAFWTRSDSPPPARAQRARSTPLTLTATERS